MRTGHTRLSERQKSLHLRRHCCAEPIKRREFSRGNLLFIKFIIKYNGCSRRRLTEALPFPNKLQSSSVHADRWHLTEILDLYSDKSGLDVTNSSSSSPGPNANPEYCRPNLVQIKGDKDSKNVTKLPWRELHFHFRAN